MNTSTTAPRARTLGALLLLGACLSPAALGCALTSKSEAVVPRYFSPELTSGRAPSAAGHVDTRLELKLGHVDHASYLDERVVYRDSAYELGYYEERRWTEAPDEYLKRELGRVLFEERGLRRVIGGAGPTLETELTGFEEIRAPAHVARVQVTARLQDDRLVRWVDTFTVDQAISQKPGADDASAVAAALGQALRTVVAQIADRAVSTLNAPPPVEATSTKTVSR